MAHGLIFGGTLSGKTLLATEIARDHKQSGRHVFTLDPLRNPTLQQASTWFTDNRQRFLRMAWSNADATLIIDEAGDMVGPHPDEQMRALATKGRHEGHTLIMIAQRAEMLSLTMRAQAHWLALFAICYDDAKKLAKDFRCPDLIRAADFAPGDYAYVHRGEKAFSVNNIFAELDAKKRK